MRLCLSDRQPRAATSLGCLAQAWTDTSGSRFSRIGALFLGRVFPGVARFVGHLPGEGAQQYPGTGGRIPRTSWKALLCVTGRRRVWDSQAPVVVPVTGCRRTSANAPRGGAGWGIRPVTLHSAAAPSWVRRISRSGKHGRAHAPKTADPAAVLFLGNDTGREQTGAGHMGVLRHAPGLSPMTPTKRAGSSRLIAGGVPCLLTPVSSSFLGNDRIPKHTTASPMGCAPDGVCSHAAASGRWVKLDVERPASNCHPRRDRAAGQGEHMTCREKGAGT